MPLPDMAALAEGGLPTGQRLVLRGGGSSIAAGSSGPRVFSELAVPHADHDQAGDMTAPPGCRMSTAQGTAADADVAWQPRRYPRAASREPA